MKKIALTLGIILSLLSFNFALANENFSFSGVNGLAETDKLQGYALFVPAGIVCSAVLSQEINSQNAVVGQNIQAILPEDFIYNDTLIASAGSTLLGSVVAVKKAGYANRNASMQIKFTTIRTPYNNIIPISANIVTSDSTGILKGGSAIDSMKDYAKDATLGAATGAVMGTIVGAISDSSTVGKGAIYGVALGAGMGIIKSAANKGESIIIPVNSRINIVFEQPITIGAQ